MTYTDAVNLEPAELYLFTQGDTVVAMTSGDRTVFHAGVQYLPAMIQREAVQLNSEINKSVLSLKVDKNNVFAQQFVAGAPFEIINVTVFRQHNMTESEYIVMFKGRVTSCSFDTFEATLTVEPISTSLRRAGLRRCYEPTCPYALYDSRCKVNKASHAVAVTGLVFLDGRRKFKITDPNYTSKAAGYFTGGIVKIGNISHMIANDALASDADIAQFPNTVHTGDRIMTLVRHLVNPGSISSFTVYPGCDLTVNTCKTTFNNLANYGGFPFMSAKNPFNSDTVQW